MNTIQLNNRLPYNPKLKDRTRELRKNMTEPEKKLRFGFFKKLPLSCQTSPSIEGENSNDSENRGSFRIYKQRPIDNFIVDFYIPKLKMVIEIDGESHFDEQGKRYDIERTAVLEGLGLEIIRFTNEEVINNFDGVCEKLEELIKKE